MRKRTLSFKADLIFWYLIYFLPVICYLIALACNNVFDLNTFFTDIGFGFATNNIVVDSLTSLFGFEGVLPLFSTTAPIYIFSWFICTFICHLAVDFLLFIPRLAHKFMDSFCSGD